MIPAIGYGIRRENRAILDDPAIDAAEITLEHADDPLRVHSFLGDMQFRYVSIHALELSVASPEPPPRFYLDTLATIAAENGADAASDHLGFTRDADGKLGMGHFAPPPYTLAALEATCRNLDIIQKHLRGLPFYLENIAYFFRFRGTMTEAEFLIRVLERSGCGWLLDVTNVYANAVNLGFDPYDFIRQVLPAAPRVQMHLAGGFFDDEAGMYIDSHSEPIPPEIWNLYRHALELSRGKVAAVFIERDDNYPDEAGWRSEVNHARLIAEEVASHPADLLEVSS